MIRFLKLFIIFFGFASWQAAAQSNRPSVAIFQMDDLAQTGAAATFSTMIETAIASTNRFRVIERERLGRLLAEQGRARAGIVTSRNRGRVGGFEGVDFLIYGSITSLSVSARSDFGASVVANLLSRDTQTCGNTVATLAIDIRITDGDSGEIRNVTRVTESQRSAAVCNAAGQIDSAVLMRSAAEKIAGALVTAIYPIQIAAVQDDGTIILNYGDGTLQAGAVLAVFSRGQPIRDPGTGQIIGNDETKLGLIRVNEITGRMSRAVAVTTFAVPPAVGAIVRPASEADTRSVGRNNNRNNRNNNRNSRRQQ